MGTVYYFNVSGGSDIIKTPLVMYIMGIDLKKALTFWMRY